MDYNLPTPSKPSDILNQLICAQINKEKYNKVPNEFNQFPGQLPTEPFKQKDFRQFPGQLATEPFNQFPNQLPTDLSEQSNFTVPNSLPTDLQRPKILIANSNIKSKPISKVVRLEPSGEVRHLLVSKKYGQTYPVNKSTEPYRQSLNFLQNLPVNKSTEPFGYDGNKSQIPYNKPTGLHKQFPRIWTPEYISQQQQRFKDTHSNYLQSIYDESYTCARVRNFKYIRSVGINRQTVTLLEQGQILGYIPQNPTGPFKHPESLSIRDKDKEDLVKFSNFANTFLTEPFEQTTEIESNSIEKESDGKSNVLPTEPSKNWKTNALPTEPSKNGKTIVLPTEPSKNGKTIVLPTEPSKNGKTIVLPTEPSKNGKTIVLPTEPSKNGKTSVLPTEPSKQLPSLFPPKNNSQLLTKQNPRLIPQTTTPPKQNPTILPSPLPPKPSKQDSSLSTPQLANLIKQIDDVLTQSENESLAKPTELFNRNIVLKIDVNPTEPCKQEENGNEALAKSTEPYKQEKNKKSLAKPTEPFKQEENGKSLTKPTEPFKQEGNLNETLNQSFTHDHDYYLKSLISTSQSNNDSIPLKQKRHSGSKNRIIQCIDCDEIRESNYAERCRQCYVKQYRQKLNASKSSSKSPTPPNTTTIPEPTSSSPEPIYCLCKQGYYGSMICCDNTKCKIQWFHFECVGLEEEPNEEVKWFCMNCRLNGDSTKMKFDNDEDVIIIEESNDNKIDYLNGKVERQRYSQIDEDIICLDDDDENSKNTSNLSNPPMNIFEKCPSNNEENSQNQRKRSHNQPNQTIEYIYLSSDEDESNEEERNRKKQK